MRANRPLCFEDRSETRTVDAEVTPSYFSGLNTSVLVPFPTISQVENKEITEGIVVIYKFNTSPFYAMEKLAFLRYQ